MEIRDRERLRGSKNRASLAVATSSGGVSDVGGPERSAIRRPGPEGGLKHGRCRSDTADPRSCRTAARPPDASALSNVSRSAVAQI